MAKIKHESKVGKCECGGDIVSYILEYSSGRTDHVVGCDSCGKDNLDIRQ